MKIERIIIAVLLALLVWFGTTIVRLEKYHYAAQNGLCEDFRLPDRGEKDRCLDHKLVRTSGFMNLLYGLRVL